MEGWIKLHRKIAENSYYFSEKFTRSQAWIDLIIIANHKEGRFYIRGIKVIVKRGQIGWGIEKLSERWQWSKGKVVRFLSELENDKQITRQKNNVTTLISLTNYEKYQMVNKAVDTTNSKAKKHQTKNHAGINNNENINNNKEKLILPYNSNSFKVKWSTLLKEKQWMGKSETALKTALKKLAEVGEFTAIKMMDNAIIGEWKGLFDIEAKKSSKNERGVYTTAIDLR